MSKITSASLYFTEGSSDKEYHIQMAPKANGWVVNFQYGRRGATMKCGTKTEEPITLDAASFLYEDLLKKQLKKGYTSNEIGKPYQDMPSGELVSGLTLQLLNAISESQAQGLMGDDSWLMQQKHDGVRMATRKRIDGIEGVNRRGLVTALPMNVVDDLNRVSGTWVLDGELVGEKYFVFDLLSHNDIDMRDEAFSERLLTLEALLLDLSFSRNIFISKVAKTSESKKALYQLMLDDKQEGVVFKLATSIYTPGRPNSGGTQLKRKFIEQVSVIVIEPNADRRSVLMGLFNDKGDLVPVGNCTIPPNYKVPATGEIAEVSYLYAFDGGSIFQPTWCGVRDDITISDCKISQLKFKPQGDLKKSTRSVKP